MRYRGEGYVRPISLLLFGASDGPRFSLNGRKAQIRRAASLLDITRDAHSLKLCVFLNFGCFKPYGGVANPTLQEGHRCLERGGDVVEQGSNEGNTRFHGVSSRWGPQCLTFTHRLQTRSTRVCEESQNH